MRKNNTFVHIHDNTFALYCFDLRDPKDAKVN